MNNFVTNDMAEALKGFYDEDDAAKAVFDWFASRQNDASETPADRAVAKAGIDYPDIIRVFRRLDDLDCGSLLMGRKGHKTRMVWAYSIRSLAKAAQGKGHEIKKIDPDLVEESTEDDDDDNGNALVHEFQLRAGSKIQFKLPADLSSKEAERLASFIKTLPFD